MFDVEVSQFRHALRTADRAGVERSLSEVCRVVAYARRAAAVGGGTHAEVASTFGVAPATLACQGATDARRRTGLPSCRRRAQAAARL
jgi:hypothetical protein